MDEIETLLNGIRGNLSRWGDWTHDASHACHTEEYKRCVKCEVRANERDGRLCTSESEREREKRRWIEKNKIKKETSNISNTQTIVLGDEQLENTCGMGDSSSNSSNCYHWTVYEHTYTYTCIHEWNCYHRAMRAKRTENYIEKCSRNARKCVDAITILVDLHVLLYQFLSFFTTFGRVHIVMWMYQVSEQKSKSVENKKKTY